MKDCYYDLGLHFILLDDPSQSYILKLRDRGFSKSRKLVVAEFVAGRFPRERDLPLPWHYRCSTAPIFVAAEQIPVRPVGIQLRLTWLGS